MELTQMLAHCRTFEERAAALFRRFAAASRGNPELCALWTGLAREEEAHARSLAGVADTLRPIDAQRVRLDGWSEALGAVAAQLTLAESLPASAPMERQLIAALDLERTELEAARRALVAASGLPVDAEPQADHAVRLAAAAVRLSEDPEVRLAAALLRTRALLADRTRASA